MMFKNKSSTVILVAACFCSMMQFCTEQAFGKYASAHFEQFRRELNLSADQQSRLDAISRQFEADQAKVDAQWKQLQEEEARPKDNSFYVKYGKQLGVVRDAYTPEDYAKACRAAYFRNQESIFVKQITGLTKEKDEKTMAILTPEQRTRWKNFDDDLKDK